VLTHPIRDQLDQLGLAGMAEAFAELEASGEGASLTHADWLGLLVDRELTHRRDKRLALGCAMPNCATTLLSRISITAPREASIAGCSTSLSAANGSMRTTI